MIRNFFIFILIFNGLAQAQNARILKGQSKSRFDWEKLTPDKFLNYVMWKKSVTEKKEFDPYLDKTYLEVMGKVMTCVGKCQLSRGHGQSQVNFLSTLREGDEFETLENSYAWIFMMDGSLLRLAPNSSVSFKEINVGKTDVFVHLRMNNGLFYWANRSEKFIPVSNKYETDALFLPLPLPQANKIEIVNRKDPLSLLQDNGARKLHYERANEWISKNNVLSSRKKSYSYLVLPNATIKGRGLRAHIFVANGSKSFFKVEGEKEPGKFMLRGYKNKDQLELNNEDWIEVDESGKSWTQKTDLKAPLKILEFLVKRIPSILLAREMMFRKYCVPLYNTNLSSETLAKNFGYRLWDSLENKSESDLAKRILFLDEYVRRTETTLLQESAELYKKSAFYKKRDFSSNFFGLALRAYLGTVSGDNSISKKSFFNYFVDEAFSTIEEI